MNMSQKITAERKKKGLTQEDLAGKAGITVRTIQRIEAGETLPRPFTLKAIAAALDIPFEAFAETEEPATTATIPANTVGNEERHFLSMLSLSCFCYLVIPFVHFLVPLYILRKRKEKNPVVLEEGRSIFRTQVFWAVTMHLLFLLTLAYNIIQKVYFNKGYYIHYLVIFFMMYFANAIIIYRTWRRVNRINFSVSS